jgi:hypothetical protein
MMTVKMQQVTIPSWLVEILKPAAAVIAAIAISYSRFVSLEKDVEDLKKTANSNAVKSETQRDALSMLATRQSTVELKQSVLEKGITESLVRIETTIKDIQVDMKELQKGR